jgi:hypothetical protein
MLEIPARIYVTPFLATLVVSHEIDGQFFVVT